ncbi:glycosyltransferase family 2 protein [Pseudooceanicola nanhaiensis]|uniref:glycosyltransferase family 2 protein n=1 Tax=Pseudooceanicola nanhaiensis TaxID=375761 RepID=UPI001CD2AB95|nr:glycosyltransferase family 2 protein [Pseudooceanicola nanhaiensis]MCA0921004.1 glycosyltransferase family 2 protein [Pseudooceanicola nanhaiensis]
MPRILAILTVRNEAAFLLDWIAHHQAAGISDFLVYSNDCEDGTDAMLDRLQALGLLTHQRNPGPYDSRGIQFTALKDAERHPLVKSADWLLPLDVDEYVNVKIGDHTLPALIDALPEATAITLTWRLFGNAGEVRYRDIPVTRAFTRAAPAVLYWPWRAAMFKTLYRNDGSYRRLGVHRPRGLAQARADTVRWFDGRGRELDAQFTNRRIFSNFGRDNYGLVQLNHYALGAMESYLLKADRGRAVHDGDRLGLDYWVERNFNDEDDSSIAALSEPTKARKDALLADAELARLHHAAVSWRRRRFDELMQQEPYRALMGRLMLCPPTKPLSLKEARFLIARGSAPQG